MITTTTTSMTALPVGSHVRPGLSLFGRLTITALTQWCWLRGYARALWLWPAYKGAWPWDRLLNISIQRAKGVFSAEQRKAMAPTSGEIIAAWAGRNGVGHKRSHVVVQGFPDIWLHELTLGNGEEEQGEEGTMGAGKDVFYVHGGGYVNTISPVHMPTAQAILQASNNDKGGRVYIPEYSLAPVHPYPAALVQVITALTTVLKLTPPGQLVLAGDSAGGGLLAGALAHLLHPTPIAPFINLPDPIAAAILISPYLSFHRPAVPCPASYTENAEIDFVSRTADLRFQALYAPKTGDVYAEPGLGDATFWRGIGDKVGRVYVVAGQWELIRDDIVAFGATLKRVDGGVVLEVADKAVHTEVAIDFGTYYEGGEMLRLIRGFCNSLT
jgi:acetyl esterase/lipase